MKTFQDIYNFALMSPAGTILSAYPKSWYKGLTLDEKINKIRTGYLFAVDKKPFRKKMLFRICCGELDMVHIAFNPPFTHVIIHDVDDFGTCDTMMCYTLPIDSLIKEVYKLPIVRKHGFILLSKLRSPKKHSL